MDMSCVRRVFQHDPSETRHSYMDTGQKSYMDMLQPVCRRLRVIYPNMLENSDL